MISHAIATLMLFVIGSLSILILGPFAGFVAGPLFYMAFCSLKLLIDELVYSLKSFILRAFNFLYKIIKLS